MMRNNMAVSMRRSLAFTSRMAMHRLRAFRTLLAQVPRLRSRTLRLQTGFHGFRPRHDPSAALRIPRQVGAKASGSRDRGPRGGRTAIARDRRLRCTSRAQVVVLSPLGHKPPLADRAWLVRGALSCPMLDAFSNTKRPPEAVHDADVIARAALESSSAMLCQARHGADG